MNSEFFTELAEEASIYAGDEAAGLGMATLILAALPTGIAAIPILGSL